ncbi:MAG: hypothetical protein MH204_06550 [Fimbriimonadaceae bacterium]|nr:hypothetical protein [Fimbriimonadaceae bacterium]
MKRTALLISALLCLPAIAPAQASQPTGLSGRVGLYLPSNGAARDEAPTWFALGLDYRLGYLGPRNVLNRDVDAFASLSIDWYGAGGFNAVPVMLNYTARQDSFYGGVGAGLALQRRPTTTGSTNDTRFTFQLSVGYDFVRFNQPYFAELRYWGSSSAQHSGFGVYAGIRF